MKSRSVDIAIEAVNKTHFEIAEELETNKEFADMWQATLSITQKAMEYEATIRATYGWKEPIRYRDEIIGYKTVFHNPLTMFMLRAAMPEKYSFGGEVSDNDKVKRDVEKAYQRMFDAMPGMESVTSAASTL